MIIYKPKYVLTSDDVICLMRHFLTKFLDEKIVDVIMCAINDTLEEKLKEYNGKNVYKDDYIVCERDIYNCMKFIAEEENIFNDEISDIIMNKIDKNMIKIFLANSCESFGGVKDDNGCYM